MFSLKNKQYLFVFGASVILFITNNIIFGRIIPRLPGGSAFGITTMFTITLVSFILKRFGCIPIMYFTYSLIGIPSHLIANDWSYLVLVLLLVVSAFIFDWLLYKKNYQISSYYIALPIFMVLTKVMNFIFVYFFKGERPIIELKIETMILSLVLGYIGITLAYILIKNQSYKKFNYKI